MFIALNAMSRGMMSIGLNGVIERVAFVRQQFYDEHSKPDDEH